eukprot:359194-Chlamydomonas_euryale.AAC.10
MAPMRPFVGCTHLKHDVHGQRFMMHTRRDNCCTHLKHDVHKVEVHDSKAADHALDEEAEYAEEVGKVEPPHLLAASKALDLGLPVFLALLLHCLRSAAALR